MEKKLRENKFSAGRTTRSKGRSLSADGSDTTVRSRSKSPERTRGLRTPAKTPSKCRNHSQSCIHADVSSSEDFVDSVGNSFAAKGKGRGKNRKFCRKTPAKTPLSLDSDSESSSNLGKPKIHNSKLRKGVYLPVVKVISAAAGSLPGPLGAALDKAEKAPPKSNPAKDESVGLEEADEKEFKEHEDFFEKGSTSPPQGTPPGSPSKAVADLDNTLNAAASGSVEDHDATLTEEKKEEETATKPAKTTLTDMGIFTQTPNNSVEDLDPDRRPAAASATNQEGNTTPNSQVSLNYEYSSSPESIRKPHLFHGSSSSQGSFDPDLDLPPPSHYEALAKEVPPPDADPDHIYNLGKSDPRPISPESSPSHNPTDNLQSLHFQASGTVAGAFGVAQPSTTYAQALSPLAAKTKGSSSADKGEDDDGEEEEEDMDAQNTARPKRTRRQAQIISSDTDTDSRPELAQFPKIKIKTKKTFPTIQSSTSPLGNLLEAKPPATSTPVQTRPPSPARDEGQKDPPPAATAAPSTSIHPPTPDKDEGKNKKKEEPNNSAPSSSKDGQDKDKKKEEDKTKPATSPSSNSGGGNATASKTGTKPKDQGKQRLPQPPGLVRLPEVPRERDTRFLNCGYVYTTQEQWKEDKEFNKFQLKVARAEIAKAIFDTGHESEPTAFLRRFWASTGVAKSKSLNEIIADLVNAKEGWIDTYNKWTDMDESSTKWADTLNRLQEQAIKLSRTPAFKRQQQAKKEAEEATRKKIEEEAKAKGINPGGGGPLPPPKNQDTSSPSTSSSSSNKNSRFNKLAKAATGEPGAGTNGAAASSSSAAEAKPPTKPSNLKPPPGRTSSLDRNRKNVSFEGDNKAIPSLLSLDIKTPPKKTPPPTDPGSSTKAQDRITALRKSRQDKPPAQEGVKERLGNKDTQPPRTGVQARIGKKKDYFLVNLVQHQTNTHRPKPKAQPQEATPPQPQTPGSSPDQAGGAQGTAIDSGLVVDDWSEDHVQVHASNHDMTFSPEKQGKHSTPNKEFTPNSSISSQAPENSDTSDPEPPKVVIESLPMEGKPGVLNSGTDLTTFQARIEAAVDHHNENLSEEEGVMPIRILDPDWDRGRFHIVPADASAGDQVIDLINNKIKLPGHKLRAAWNHDLPKTAVISLRYKSVAERRDHRQLIEDPKKGLARMNGWKVEGKEITFIHAKADPNNANIQFVTVQVSERICKEIQKQQGKLWISGGTATAQWSNKDLTPEVKVNFSFQ